MAKNEETQSLCVRVPVSLVSKLEEVGKEDNRSKGNLVNHLLVEGLKDKYGVTV